MQRVKDRIYSACLSVGYKVAPVYVILVSCALQENGIQVFKQIFLQFAVIVYADSSKTKLHIPIMENLVQVEIQWSEGF